MSNHKREEQAEFKEQFSDFMLLLFLWFVFAIICSVGNTTLIGVHPTAIGQFFIFSTVTIAIAAVLGAIFRNTQLLVVLSFLTYVSLCIFPGLILPTKVIDKPMLLDFLFILLILSPGFCGLWSWKVQSIASVFAVLGSLFQKYPLSRWIDIQSILFVAITAIIVGLMTFLRQSTEQYAPAKGGRKYENSLIAAKRLSSVKDVQRALVLQLDLFIVLIIFDVLSWHEQSNILFLSKIYGLLILLFASIVIKIIKGENLHYLLAIVCIAVSLPLSVVLVTISITQHGQPWNTLLQILPLTYIAFCPLITRWPLIMQTLTCWSILGANVVISIIILIGHGIITASTSGKTGGISFAYNLFGELFQEQHQAIAFLTCSVALSIAVAKFFDQKQQRSLSQLIDYDTRKFEESSPLQSSRKMPLGQQPTTGLLSSCVQPGILSSLFRQLLVGLFVLGICSSFVSSLLIVKINFALWPFAALQWILFLSLWFTGLYISRKYPKTEHLWSLGAFLAVLLFLVPGVLLISTNDTEGFWVFWPIALLMGFGLIPWGKLESIVPLVVVTGILGSRIVDEFSLGPRGALLFTGATVFGMLYSLQSAGRLKEQYLLTNFQLALQSCWEEKECLRVVIDFLMAVLGSPSALLSIGENHLELIRNSRFYTLSSASLPLWSLREGLTNLPGSSPGVRGRFLNSISPDFGVIDPRFGIFSFRHGFLLELALLSRLGDRVPTPEQLPSAISTSVPHRQALILLTSSFPIIAFFRYGELLLAETMLSFSSFRLEALHEVERRVVTEFTCDAAQTEREYELSTLVHDVNNSVQDLTLLCDSILEHFEEEGIAQSDSKLSQSLDHPEDQDEKSKTNSSNISKDTSLVGQVQRIAVMARSMATVVSDSKRKRELERIQDLTPREMVEAIEVVKDMVSFATIRGERKRIQVTLSGALENQAWCKVSAREHLETILRNLLNNAITYSDPGSTVRVEIALDDNWITIQIIDTGPGLSTEECKIIFLPGYRGTSGRNVAGGLGVGLSQSRRVAEAAGGTLTASSPGTGLGSTFTVRLPRQAVSPTFKKVPAWALMVDDQPALTEFYTKVAKALNLVPVVASSVDEATQILTMKGEPIFVLTDLHLGKSDGLDLVKFVRKHLRSSIPILVVSGLTDHDIEQRVRQAGATDFISKPIGRRALFARIQSLLERG